ncbi:glycoside hydrolase family 65 protein [Pigmentiphaga litoralis]|uniref:glycoside hydrolase family 65 protein n=1 Tax=Pigmentiphaga litoralis TaxID=516702 RepID=UPI0016795F42|nr:glycoside hydrolase family 65 protein [Pigmentiphaga litoralis]
MIEFTHYDAADEARREALFTLGNGCLIWRASAPEAAHLITQADTARRIHYAGLYHAGWYDDAPRQVNGKVARMGAIVNLPDPFGLTLALDDGDWFDIHQAHILSYRQQLDLEASVLERLIVVKVDGGRLCLREQRVVSMADPSCALLRWRVRVPGTVQRVKVRAQLRTHVSNTLVHRNAAYEGQRLTPLATHHNEKGVAAVLAHLDDASRRVMVACRNQVEPAVDTWRTRDDDGAIVLEADLRLDTARTLTIEQRAHLSVGHTSNSASRRDPHSGSTPLDTGLGVDCTTAIGLIPDAPFDRLLDAHRAAWARLWDSASIRAADADLDRALRFAVWHIFQAVSPLSAGRDQGFPPRGWGEGYFGQIFWDDMFVFPFLVTHCPELAHSLLTYRHRRLPEARARAQQAGLAGAMFPWRSAWAGSEETPPFQCNPLSGHWMPDPTHLQRHVGAAIVHNVWQLYLATHDRALLEGEGGDLMMEIARFWSSLARFDDVLGRYVIRGVLGPDEYHTRYPGSASPGLDNNAYTNLMAVWSLCKALEVIDLLPPDKAVTLRNRIGIHDDELARWDDISRRMSLPFVAPDVLSQFDGYTGLQHAPSAWRVDERPRLDWLLESRGDDTANYQLTKQADVLCLFHLLPAHDLRSMIQRLGYTVGPPFMRKTADFHLARITHESSLSKMVCAGALTRLDPATSWSYFQECVLRDLAMPGGGVAEGVHLGAMAGSLDILQRHYLGITPARDGLHVQPAPPPGLGAVSVKIRYRGARLRADLKDGQLDLTVLQTVNDTPVAVVHGATVHQLRQGSTLTLPLDAAN